MGLEHLMLAAQWLQHASGVWQLMPFLKFLPFAITVLLRNPAGDEQFGVGDRREVETRIKIRCIIAFVWGNVDMLIDPGTGKARFGV